MFKNRSVTEIMVITFTFVVAFIMMTTGAVVVLIEVNDPSADTSGMLEILYTAFTTVLGALLGLLAGKSEGKLNARPDEKKDDAE